MPLDADGFVRSLESVDGDLPGRSTAKRQNRLERPTLWGEAVPMDSGSMATQGYAGLREYGGV